MKIFSVKKEFKKIKITFLGIKISIKRKTRKTNRKKVSFYTFQNLASIIRQNISKLPSDIDLIVGIPRSGMIPAYIIGLFLNKNICSLPEFMAGITPSKGERTVAATSSGNILIVDDSVFSGNALEKTKNILKTLADYDKYNFRYCAVFATDRSQYLVDYYFELAEDPRLFQWNYLNHSLASSCCYDFDGVLCVDPTDEENDDGEKYINFILNAKPLFIPQQEIHSIITSRLEKYRPQTEKWLRDHQIKYKNLYMLDLPSAAERRRLDCHADFKAKIYSKLKDTICFIESDPVQAQKIADLSGKQCICCSTDEYFPGKY